jgi:hypothetical protein
VIRAATKEEIEDFERETNYCPSKKAKGIVNEVDGKVAAMIIYDYWTYTSVQVHIHAPNFRHFIDPKFIHEIFHYPFITCDRKVLVAVTPDESKGSLAVSKWLGFKETYRMKDGWCDGEDMVLKELKRADCRWLQQKAA